MIEEKLQISRYLSWTFCSCIIGMFNGLDSLSLSMRARGCIFVGFGEV